VTPRSPDGEPPTAPRRARKPRDPVTTLVGFFEKRAFKPATFLKDLRAADRWGFEEDDIAAALESHADRDKDFVKTVQLIAAALKERDRRYAGGVVDFGERAIRRRLADNPHAIGIDFDAAPSPEETIGLTVRALTPRFRESKRRTESANLLLATVLCLSHKHGLAGDSAIDVLVVALAPERPTRRSQALGAKLVWLGERPRDLRHVIDLLSPSIHDAHERGAEIDRLRGSLDAERETRRLADAEVVRLSARLADLEETLANARNELERLEESTRAAGVHADHDVKSARARVAGLLDGQMRDLVVTVDEALSVDPPRVDVAREKAEVLLRELERQVAWLRS
jgi:hypothetical protein